MSTDALPPTLASKPSRWRVLLPKVGIFVGIFIAARVATSLLSSDPDAPKLDFTLDCRLRGDVLPEPIEALNYQGRLLTRTLPSADGRPTRVPVVKIYDYGDGTLEVSSETDKPTAVPDHRYAAAGRYEVRVTVVYPAIAKTESCTVNVPG